MYLVAFAVKIISFLAAIEIIYGNQIEPLHGKEPGVKQILATEEKTLKQQNALEEELRKKEIEIKQLNDISSRYGTILMARRRLS